MKLTKLVINNFGPVNEATLYLADKGLVSIEGVNLDGSGSDSNGSGKSTIINAILWCNYGEAGKSIKADSVVNRKTKKDCFVESTWEEDGRVHRVTRYRKHKTHKNSVRVERLEGETWQDITKAGAVAVQHQINELLGQDFLTFQASCFAQQDESLDIPAMGDKALKELLERVLPFENLDEEYDKATKEVADQRKLVEKLEDEVKLKAWQIETNKESGKAAVKLFKSYASDIETSNANIQAKIDATSAKVKEQSKSLTDTLKLQEQYDALQAEVESYGDVTPNTTTIVFLEKEIELKEKEHDEANNRCPVCEQETESKEGLQARLRISIDRLNVDLEEAEKQALEIADRTAKRKAAADKMVTLSKRQRTHDEAAASIRGLKREISLLQGQKQEVGVNPHKATVDGFKTAYDAAVTGKREFEAKLAEAKEGLELKEAVQQTFSPKGVRYHMLEAVAPKLTNLTNKYLKVLTDGAIEAVWSTVTRTSTGEYREKFSITTIYDGDEAEYGSLSGGEKRKVRLACFFGLQDLIASRATKNISIWCGDEIDHALDSAGIERLMTILEAKTKSKSTILVISHNAMREWIPNLVVVTRKDKLSTIKGYLNEQS